MNLRVPESVRSIIILRQDVSGRMVSTTLHEREVRKRKSSGWLRPLDKMLVSAAKGEQAFATTYLVRHRRSNEKKKNGWIQDLPYNLMKADSKRRKKWKVLDSVIRVFM